MTTTPTLRIAVATIALPLTWTAVAAAASVSWRSDLPDPIAVHWGANSVADGFGSPDMPLWITAGIAVSVVPVGTAITATARSRTVVRTFAGMISGLAAFLAGIVVTTMWVQRGVVDAAQVPFPGWAIPVAGAVAIGAGFLASAIIPSWPGEVGPPVSDAADALPIGPNERVVWSSSATSPLPVVLLGGLGVVATATSAILLGTWWMLTIAVLLLVMMAAMLSIRVTVDRGGLQIRGPLGRPRIRIAPDDIATVGTTRVRALRDFGGFGYRVAMRGALRGARGFILRSGDALVVTTRDGRTEVTVVDDAHTGAAVLEAVRLREANRTS